MKKVKFSSLLKKFDCFLLDQWGVIHDGKKKFNYIDKTLSKLKHKKVIILSNTSQNKIEAVSQTLHKLKIKYNFFNDILTSGEFLEYLGKSKSKKFKKIQTLLKKKKCFLISNGNRSKIIKNLNLKTVSYKKAKFILATSIKPNVKISSIENTLKKLLKRKIEMICTNPDQYVYDGKVRNFVNQVGVLAKFYEDHRGTVHYIGKPYRKIFDFALRKHNIPKNKIIMIGDSLLTDILGAKRAGIKSALAYDGFIKSEKKIYKQFSFEKILKITKIRPDFIIKNIKL